MFRHIRDTGNDMSREKISDSLIHHVDKAVAVTIPSAHLKILQSPLPTHSQAHFSQTTMNKEERGDSLISKAVL